MNIQIKAVSSFNIYWIKQPDDYLEQKFKFDLPPAYWPNGTPKAPDNNFGAVDPLGGAMGVPQFSM